MTANQILATTFTLMFEGLMLFQGDTANSKSTVVIVHDATHHKTPSITIYPSKEVIPLQQGDKVTFSNLAAGVATTKKSFNEHVPKLPQHIKKGHVHDDVIGQSALNEGIEAVVFLPEGDLTAMGTLPKVRLEKTTGLTFTKTLCMAELVFLQSEASSDVDLMIHHRVGGVDVLRLKKTIPKDGGVRFSNASDDETFGTHFHLYSALLNKGGEIGKVTAIGGQCGNEADFLATAKRISSAATAAVATRRIPNGDCGPVDNP